MDKSSVRAIIRFGLCLLVGTINLVSHIRSSAGALLICAVVALVAIPSTGRAALVPIDKDITFGDIEKKPMDFSIPEGDGVDKTFRIRINDIAWGPAQHDTRLFDDADLAETKALCQANIKNCSDVIRFVDVDGLANIFFVSDGEVMGDLDLTGVPDLPATAPGPGFFDERLVAAVNKFEFGGGLPDLFVISRSSDVSGNSDGITLVTPAPATLALIGYGLVLLAWMRTSTINTGRTTMKAMLFVLATALVCIGPMRAPAAANLVQNGDFSTHDLTGWTPINVDISGNYGGHVTQKVNGPESLITVACFSDLGCGAFIPVDNNWGAITQTLVTVPNQTYQVDYVVAVLDGPCTGDSCGTSGGFVTIFDGIGYMGASPKLEKGPKPPDFPPLPPGSPITPGAFYFFGTYHETFFATATTSDAAIEFASTCPGCNFFITDVSVRVPEPSTVFLLAAGLLGIWIGGRRGRTKCPRLPT